MPPIPAGPDLLNAALDAADAAAEVHRRYRGVVGMGQAVSKGRSDFVSQVDLEAQEAVLAVIRSRFPDHGIISEEEDGSTGPSSPSPVRAGRPIWVVDPLDGTTNFLHGHPQYASSVAVCVDGVPIAGAIVAASTGERWWGLQGAGAFRNGERIHASSVREIELALVGTGFPRKRPAEVPRYLEEFARIVTSTSGIRRGGSAALDFCYLAQGSLDAFWEGLLAPWDVAAGLVILSEAGGVAVRRDGLPPRADEPGPVLAANSPELLADLRRLVKP